MTDRYWPLARGCAITSPFGWRAWDNAVHAGIDFGSPEGSPAGWPVYAVQSGTVLYCGAAEGYGGPDPAGWIVIDSDDSQGSGVFEYGHVIRESWIKVGATVEAGQQIGVINGDKGTNGDVDAHVHVSRMPYAYNPKQKYDWSALLDEALYAGEAPEPQEDGGENMTDGGDVRVQMRGPSDGGWPGLAPQPDEEGNRWSAFLGKAVTAQTVVEALGTIVFELTLRLPREGRGILDFKKRKGDTVLGYAANAAAISAENQEILLKIAKKVGLTEDELKQQ